MWSNFDSGAPGSRVEKDGRISANLTCAIAPTDNIRSSNYPSAIKSGGVALFPSNSPGNTILFVPAEKNELQNHCLVAIAEVPKQSRKLTGVGFECSLGYSIYQKYEFSPSTQVEIKVKVIDGDGIPVAGARVDLEVANDGKPAIKRIRTNKRGRAILKVPFNIDSEIRYCELGSITVGKAGYSRSKIYISDPKGSCGSCA